MIVCDSEKSGISSIYPCALHCISIELFVLSSNVQANIKRMILQINNNTDRSAVACDAFHFGKLMHSKYCYSGRLQCRTELKLWSALIWIMLILRLFFSVFLLALSLSVFVCLFCFHLIRFWWSDFLFAVIIFNYLHRKLLQSSSW